MVIIHTDEELEVGKKYGSGYDMGNGLIATITDYWDQPHEMPFVVIGVATIDEYIEFLGEFYRPNSHTCKNFYKIMVD